MTWLAGHKGKDLRALVEMQTESKTHSRCLPTGAANAEGLNIFPLNKHEHLSCWQRFIFPWICLSLWKILRWYNRGHSP